MSMYKSRSLGWLAIALCIGLVACGSGKTPVAQTGQFVDAAVIGASYVNSPSGLSGVTDSNGNYDYLPGDTVTFSIGNIVFPSAIAKGTVTPFDLAGIEYTSGTSATDFENAVVINISRLLQTLDTDSNPDNGITLDSSVTGSGSAYNFNQSLSSFQSDFKADFPNLTLVSTTDALTHLFTQLDALATNSGTTTSGTCATAAADGPNEEPAVISASIAGTYTLPFNESAPGSNIADGTLTEFVVGEDGTLTIDGSLTLCAPVLFAGNEQEAIWKDKDNGLSYALSSLTTGFNEINVGSFVEGDPVYGVGFTFYGQYSDKK